MGTELLSIFQDYRNMSGQVVNFEKTNILFSSNVSKYVKEKLAVYWQTQHIFSEKYLELLTMVGRVKIGLFSL